MSFAQHSVRTGSFLFVNAKVLRVLRRLRALNLAVFTETIDASEALKVESSDAVDWSAWRSETRKRTPE